MKTLVHSPLTRIAIAGLMGAFAVLALPPYHYIQCFFIAFSALIYLLHTSPSAKQSFWLGWAFGFGYFVAGLYWIANALRVDADQWGWMIPLASIGLPLFLAIFWGIAGLATSKTRDKPIVLIFTAAAAFAAVEYLRGCLFTGFPWNLPAYIWMENPTAQTLSVFGAYGLTLVTFFVSAIFFSIYAQVKKHPYTPLTTLGLILVMCAMFSFGLWRFNHLQNTITQSDIRIALVQPNIQQSKKWSAEHQIENLETLTRLTRQASNADIVIWPETAITYREDDIPTLFTREDTPFLKDTQSLISGVIHVDDQNNYFNSLVTLDHTGTITGRYNKHHLVPFGEYVPFRNLVSFGPIATALENTGDFSAGGGLKTMTLDGLSFSPLICYEVLFPGRSHDNYDRPDAIINITNDAWYGDTSGPRQHLAITRARAIEAGLPAVRIAGTGISAIITPDGYVTRQIALNTQGVIRAFLAKPLKSTLYSRHKEWPFFIFLILAVIHTLYFSRKK